MAEPKIRCNYFMPPELLQKLDEISVRYFEGNKSEVIRTALEKFIIAVEKRELKEADK